MKAALLPEFEHTVLQSTTRQLVAVIIFLYSFCSISFYKMILIYIYIFYEGLIGFMNHFILKLLGLVVFSVCLFGLM